MTKGILTKGNMTITTPSDREIQMTRVFDAPRHLVYQAYTQPDLVKRWLGVFDGWSLDVCEIDLRVGGAYRYEWLHTNGTRMGVGGVYQEIVPSERIVITEKFDDPWYEGEALGTVDLEEEDGQTTLKTTLRYISKEVRDKVLASPMETGVGASYDKLAEVLAMMEA
jgi:uncharacterized protein YndB with AHSA1/START domain